MGGNPAKTANAISQASLNEQRRVKAAAKANAASIRTSNTYNYANQLQVNNNLNASDKNFSLINTSAGTTSVLNSIIGGDQNTTLGG